MSSRGFGPLAVGTSRGTASVGSSRGITQPVSTGVGPVALGKSRGTASVGSSKLGIKAEPFTLSAAPTPSEIRSRRTSVAASTAASSRRTSVASSVIYKDLDEDEKRDLESKLREFAQRYHRDVYTSIPSRISNYKKTRSTAGLRQYRDDVEDLHTTAAYEYRALEHIALAQEPLDAAEAIVTRLQAAVYSLDDLLANAGKVPPKRGQESSLYEAGLEGDGEVARLLEKYRVWITNARLRDFPPLEDVIKEGIQDLSTASRSIRTLDALLDKEIVNVAAMEKELRESALTGEDLADLIERHEGKITSVIAKMRSNTVNTTITEKLFREVEDAWTKCKLLDEDLHRLQQEFTRDVRGHESDPEVKKVSDDLSKQSEALIDLERVYQNTRGHRLLITRENPPLLKKVEVYKLAVRSYKKSASEKTSPRASSSKKKGVVVHVSQVYNDVEPIINRLRSEAAKRLLPFEFIPVTVANVDSVEPSDILVWVVSSVSGRFADDMRGRVETRPMLQHHTKIILVNLRALANVASFPDMGVHDAIMNRVLNTGDSGEQLYSPPRSIYKGVYLAFKPNEKVYDETMSSQYNDTAIEANARSFGTILDSISILA